MVAIKQSPLHPFRHLTKIPGIEAVSTDSQSIADTTGLDSQLSVLAQRIRYDSDRIQRILDSFYRTFESRNETLDGDRDYRR